MRSSHLFHRLLSVVAFVLLGGLIATVAYASLTKPPQAPLRVAYNSWPGYDFLTVAKELGYFEEEGLDVKLIKLASLGDARRIFERGQADVLASSMAEVIYVANDNACGIKAFAICDYSCGADVLIAHKRIGSLTELRGRRVAVEPHSLDVVNLTFALQSVGMSLTDVELVLLHQAEVPRAFQEERIDAAQTYPPVSMQLRGDNCHVIFDTGQIPGKVMDCLSASTQALQTRREDLVKLARVYFRVQALYQEHPERVEPILAKHLQIDVIELRQMMQGLGLVPLSQQQKELQPQGQLVRSLETAAVELQRVGVAIEHRNWADFVDGSLVAEVLQP